ncbi:hypothetical protein BGZ63DRAFT_398537 [Mariannaea sp. PMI_226]|nr:hypothetical protein BGZ63DRAFT_398537 [Mariannaea sp. PMI_226]
MRGKSVTAWDNTEFLMDLGVGLFVAAQASGGLGQNVRDGIVTFLEKQGHTTTWEAIRKKGTMSNRQTMKWDANVHQDILIVLFQHIKLSSQDWEKIMNDLHAMDYTFTESALRQHVQKLRRTRDTSSIQNAGSGITSSFSTPKKETPRKRLGTGSGKKRKLFKAPGDDDDDDDKSFLKREMGSDDEIFGTPKVKRSKQPIKYEAENEMDSEL